MINVFNKSYDSLVNVIAAYIVTRCHEQEVGIAIQARKQVTSYKPSCINQHCNWLLLTQMPNMYMHK